MPYFPKPEEQQPYKCPGCGGLFLPGSVCLVHHAPGTCCHHGEKRVG